MTLRRKDYRVVRLTALLSVLAIPGLAEVHSSARLTIVAENVRNARGVIGVLVFHSEQGWPEKVEFAATRKAVPAHPGSTELVIDHVTTGPCAVVVLHDENKNMKLDRNVFGKPKEGWGMSNNPKAHGHAPPFAAARFQLSGDTELHIHLNY